MKKHVVRIKHVDRELAAVTLSSLSLDRNATESSWLLSNGEAERVNEAKSK